MHLYIGNKGHIITIGLHRYETTNEKRFVIERWFNLGIFLSWHSFGHMNTSVAITHGSFGLTLLFSILFHQ